MEDLQAFLVSGTIFQNFHTSWVLMLGPKADFCLVYMVGMNLVLG